MVKCAKCGLTAHNAPMGHDRQILHMTQFVGKSCFQIAHSDECAGLWNRCANAGKEVKRTTFAAGSDDELTPVTMKVKAQSYLVARSHPVTVELAAHYGEYAKRSKRQRIDDAETDDAENDNVENDDVDLFGDNDNEESTAC